MDPSADIRAEDGDEGFALDIIGQQKLLQIYTQITLCFGVPDESLHASIISTLKKGLERTASALPWLPGQIVTKDGIPTIRPLSDSLILVVKDLTHDASAPTMGALRQQRFPMSILDEGLLTYRKTLPGPIDGPAEAFSVQAVFIRDGLLLTFTGAHNVMDMMGQYQILHLIDKACRGIEFTPEELSSANLQRDTLVPLFDESYIPGPELENQFVKPQKPAPAPDGTPAVEPPPPTPWSWACFTFTAESLRALKALATSTLPAAGPTNFISTDDALTAFIWQSFTRARLPHLLADPSRKVVKMTRAVDVRSCLGVPATYTGVMQNLALHTQPISDAIEPANLGSIAADMRAALALKDSTPKDGRWDLASHTRALATATARTADKASVTFTAALDLDADIMISSWAKVGCYDLDFGFGLGKPEAVCRPRFDVVPSLIYFMPRDRAGGVAVTACLRDDEIAALREDAPFAKHAVYVG